ncbi:MAG TPA: hypothetical protein VMV90_02450 [Rectinemataceae bacterium]|nr:hypothetical protein [Rectinemataceae bacterium]
MARNADGVVKGDRVQIRITQEQKERFALAMQRLRPHAQFQEFLLELTDKGLELMEYEHSLIGNSASEPM